MSEGFLGRWSRLKTGARTADERTPGTRTPQDQTTNVRPTATPGASPVQDRPAIGPIESASSHQSINPPSPSTRATAANPAATTPSDPEPPTLAEALQLKPESDFKPFLARNVAPEVRNTALKRLFSDPHFNIMDGLDIYIDDYSQPDPIPPALLQQLMSAESLNLFSAKTPPESDSESTSASASTSKSTSTSTSTSASASVESAESATAVKAPERADSTRSAPVNDPANPPQAADPRSPSQDPHDHTDLRLQSDDAPGLGSPRDRAG